jgi:hypothetical protein
MDSVDQQDLKEALREVIREELGLSDTDPGEKWQDAEIVIRSTRGAPREKVIPLDGFFRKIVLVRDRLRVLEQRINAHPRLGGEEKVRLHQYITKIYGTLTTFNFLFRSREDHFVGERKSPGPVARPVSPPPGAGTVPG